MIIRLIAWLWLIAGIIFLIWPQGLRGWLQKKSLKKVRKYLFVLSIILSLTLIIPFWKYPGILPKIFVVLGVIGVFKAFFLLKAKAAEKIIGWWIKLPPTYFRLAAALLVAVGIAILRIRR